MCGLPFRLIKSHYDHNLIIHYATAAPCAPPRPLLTPVEMLLFFLQPAASLFRCTSGPGAMPASSLPPDWRELHCAQQLVAFLCVPLTQEGGKVVGTLTLASGDGES